MVETEHRQIMRIVSKCWIALLRFVWFVVPFSSVSSTIATAIDANKIATCWRFRGFSVESAIV